MFIQLIKKEQERIEEHFESTKWRKKKVSEDEKMQAKSKLPTLDEKAIDNALKLAKNDYSFERALTFHPDHTKKTLQYLLDKISQRKNQELLTAIFTHPNRTKKLVSEGVKKIADFLLLEVALINNELSSSDINHLIAIWKKDIAKPLRKRAGWTDGMGYGNLDYLFLQQKNYDDSVIGSMNLLEKRSARTYLLAFSRDNLDERLFHPYSVAYELGSILAMYKSPSCPQEFKDVVEEFIECINNTEFSPFYDK